MKLTLVALFTCIYSLFAADVMSQSAKVSIHAKSSTVQKVIKQIEQQTDYLFVYDKNDVDIKRKVSMNVNDVPVSEVLNNLFADTDVSYKVIDKNITLTVNHTNTIEDVTGTKQSAFRITGKVSDSAGEPIIGANILEKGTTNGAITDMDGNFELSVQSNAMLIVSYIGYVTQEVKVTGRTLNITMKDDTEALGEVVVVGYGTQKKVNLTGAVQSVNSKDLVKRNAPNVSTALQGIIPGLSAVQSSGQPGSDGASLRIRGVGSINSSSSPLILIDGVVGDINRIDMNTVETISVLKDAASASIYGSRASNGVILITTKRGNSGKPRVTYNGYVGFNKPTNMPEAANAIEYMEAQNKARINNGQESTYSDELLNLYRTQGADNINYFDTNWRDLLFKDLALVHNHSVGLSGGSEDVRFYANAGYFYQDGIIPNNNFYNMTLRVNTDANVTKWMKIGVDVNVRQSRDRRPGQGSVTGIISQAIGFSPIFSGVNADGTWGFGQNGDNPIAKVKDGGYTKNIFPELGVKGYIDIAPFKGMNILASYSTRKVESEYENFIKAYDTYERGVFMASWPAAGAQKTESYIRNIYNQFNLQVTYEKSLGLHDFKMLGGIQTEEINNHDFSTGRYGYNYEGFTEINHGDIATAYNSGSSSSWAMLSYLARINYAFASKYLLELNGRWDASSRFKEGYRMGFFPSISGGWRISEEKFFKPFKSIIDNLKLRVSYGTLGNQDIGGYYPYAATLGTGYGYWFNKELGSGVAQTSVANSKISWEKSHQFDFGLDASFLSSRLNVTFDYYTKNVDDILQVFPIPYFVGLSSSYQNAGSMKNKGWDLSVAWRDKIGKDFTYSFTGMLQDVKNEIIDLYGNEYIGERTITIEGSPIGSWYGYKADGYFQTQEEIDNYPVYGGNKNNYKPGYVKYIDINNDGAINDKDRTIIGDPQPRYEYSLNFGMNYKNWDFTAFFQGVGKKDIMYYGSMARPFYVGASILKSQLDNWSEENRDAEFPLLLIEGSGGSNPNNLPSTFWVKSGAYFRLKNIVVGYTMPKKSYIENLRFYVSVQNLFTVSNAYKGYDPENSVTAGNFYPVMKTFTFGINLTF